jgi:putative flavoprotein involved in K+ transport
MTESIDIAVIGAGQAGLATSWYLTQAGADHVVFDKPGVADDGIRFAW